MSQVGLGSLKLPLKLKKHFVVHGGPYYDAPVTMIGVKMAKEIRQAAHVDIPTKDFHVPNVVQLEDGLRDTVKHILLGNPVYVGCMGGRGRTGLFLAVLAKAWGVPKPVEYVRENYYSHAVETPDQYKFVQEFKVPKDVQLAINKAKWFSLFKLKNNLTRAQIS